MTDDDAIDRAAEALASARYAVALVGAGISVESGIPPFRGPGGLWTKHGEPPMDGYQRMVLDRQAYWRDIRARRAAASSDEFARAISEAVPNEGHFALARLEEIGVLKHTITQNIDNLHHTAGQRALSEVHGNRTKLRCIDCEARWPFDEFPGGDVLAGEEAPDCPRCGGFVKSDTVMFGEPIPRSVLAECHAQAERADCMLIAGTSATVTPAAWFPEMVRERGGALIEVNTEPTPFSRACVASLRGPSGVLLPQMVARVEVLLSARGGAQEETPR